MLPMLMMNNKGGDSSSMMMMLMMIRNNKEELLVQPLHSSANLIGVTIYDLRIYSSSTFNEYHDEYLLCFKDNIYLFLVTFRPFNLFNLYVCISKLNAT